MRAVGVPEPNIKADITKHLSSIGVVDPAPGPGAPIVIPIRERQTRKGQRHAENRRDISHKQCTFEIFIRRPLLDKTPPQCHGNAEYRCHRKSAEEMYEEPLRVAKPRSVCGISYQMKCDQVASVPTSHPAHAAHTPYTHTLHPPHAYTYRRTS